MQGQTDIERDKVARLTDKQRACMRLVVMRKSSKEIARELGIAKPTVDQRIINARQILGASNRNEAALIFARSENEHDRINYVPAYAPHNDELVDYPVNGVRQEISMRLEESAIPYCGSIDHRPNACRGFSWSYPGEIAINGKVLIIFGMTVGILSVMLIGHAVAQSLSELLIPSSS